MRRQEDKSMAAANQLVLRLLIIDDDLESLALLRQVFENAPFEVFATTDSSEGLDLFREKRPHIVLLGLHTAQISGMEMLEKFLEIDPGVDVILMTEHYSTDAAVEAIKKGACDYLTKPISVARIRGKVQKLLSHAQLRRQSRELEAEMIETFQFEGMIGRSPLMLDMFCRINRVAPYFRTILLSGEAGTGKELAAKALHRLGSRPSSPFIACNCSAWAEGLLETELFGCVKGAFAGAAHDRKGMFEHANGGTLLLDEISDVPLSIQAKLLRVLQDQEIQRVGSPIAYKVDVRVIAATSRDLRDMVAENRFREDLHFRLSMMEIHVPRLADRREDLPLLERYMVDTFTAASNKKIRGLTRRAQMVLSRHSWPGNVRELKNVIAHGCIMAEGDIIDAHNLPAYLSVPRNPAAGDEGKG
jgi:two-component system, NtrC family, response regulator HydG